MQTIVVTSGNKGKLREIAEIFTGFSVVSMQEAGFAEEIEETGETFAETTIQDLEDFIISNNLLPIGSILYLLFCTSRYGWGWKNFIAEADAGKGVKFPKWARFYVTYILPIIVIAILIISYIQKFA